MSVPQGYKKHITKNSHWPKQSIRSRHGYHNEFNLLMCDVSNAIFDEYQADYIVTPIAEVLNKLEFGMHVYDGYGSVDNMDSIRKMAKFLGIQYKKDNYAVLHLCKILFIHVGNYATFDALHIEAIRRTIVAAATEVYVTEKEDELLFL